MQPDNSPFFIVGSSRSGTTLLRLMVSGHSRIHIPPETWFFLPLVETLPLSTPLSESQVDQAISIIITHYRWPDMQMNDEAFVAQVRQLQSPKLADIANIVYEHHLAISGKHRFGDKTPLYVGILPELCVLYPTAKFIHLIRDGRDVSISFADADFEGRCYDGERFEWIASIHKRQAYRDTAIARRILDVRYEDLVADPRRVIGEICDFLGEAFEPAMLEPQSRKNMVPERGWHIHTKLEKPISREAIAVWKTRLNALECFAMEACIYRELQQLGYSLRYNALAWRPLLRVGGTVLRLCAPLLNRGIPFLQRRNYLPGRVYL